MSLGGSLPTRRVAPFLRIAAPRAGKLHNGSISDADHPSHFSHGAPVFYGAHKALANRVGVAAGSVTSSRACTKDPLGSKAT